MHRIARVLPRRNHRRPPGRSRRCASGIHRSGSHQMMAPYSETAKSNDASRSGTSSALASTRGNSNPCSACIRRAVSSCAGVTSTPTGRAPPRASHAETYAVPQPSSTTSRPDTSPSVSSERSGIAHFPHLISSDAHAPRACASVYSAFACVHDSRFRRASSERRVVKGGRRGRRASARAARSSASPSRGRCSR